MFFRSAGDAVPPHLKTETLGPYTLTSTFASGALATVHRAHLSSAQGANKPIVAIKRLQRRHANDSELRNLLLATGHACLRVATPDVVRIHEVHAEPEPFLVMEYVEGTNLQELLRATRGTDTSRFVLPILLDLLDGLRVLHELTSASGAAAGLVHGAPCARHVVVGHDGLGRLLDLTHAVGPDLPWSPRRDERLDPSEMAPEQALAPAHVDGRSDIFIVGILLWRVLTGKSLFGGGDLHASLQAMLRSPIPLPSEAGAPFGRGFDRICQRALQRSRAERYASVDEMASALRDEVYRAGLGATREEIGDWVQALASATTDSRERPAPGSRTTVIGMSVAEAALANAVVRPSARPIPRTTAHPQAAIARQTLTMGSMADGFLPELQGASERIHEQSVELRGAAPLDPARLSTPQSLSKTLQGPVVRAGERAPMRPSEDASLGRERHADRQAQSSVFRRPGALAAEPAAASPPAYGPSDHLVSVLGSARAWQELQPSVPPTRRRSSPTNKKAMAAGIAVALVGPVTVLFMGHDLVASPTQRQVPAHHEARAPSEPAATEQPVQNSTLDAFMGHESLRRPAAQAPAVVPPPATDQAPQAADVVGSMVDGAVPAVPTHAKTDQPSPRARVAPRAPRPRSPERERSVPLQLPEPLPVNPY